MNARGSAVPLLAITVACWVGMWGASPRVVLAAAEADSGRAVRGAAVLRNGAIILAQADAIDDVGEVAPEPAVPGEDDPAGEPLAEDGLDAGPTDAVDDDAAPHGNDESVLLNFEQGDIRAVIDSLATALGLSYMIDPRVQGQVTIRTLGRIPKADLFPVFNRILRNNGIAALKVGSVYHIVPVEEAKTRAILPPSAATRSELAAADSFVIEIIPVRHVATEDMATVLEPFITPGGDVFSYSRGNLLIVTDLGSNVARINDLIKALDTDMFRGMKTHTFKIKNGDLDVIYEEIGTLLASYGYAIDGSTGLSLLPMPRLESMTVISFDDAVLAQIGEWVRMLDIPPEEGAGRKIRVYRVENAKATELANILGELFGGDGASGGPGGGFGAGQIPGGAIGQQRALFGRPAARGAVGQPVPGRPQPQAVPRPANVRTGQQMSRAEAEDAEDAEEAEDANEANRRVTTAAQMIGETGGTGGFGGGGRGRGSGGGFGAGQQQGRGGLGRGRGGGQGSATGFGAGGGAVGVVLPGGRQGAGGGRFPGIPGPPPLLKEEVRIVADEVTNTLVILATKPDYEMILDVLREIDVVPRQVVIEVTIAEITLTKGLEFGVDHAIRYGGSIAGSASAVRNLGGGGRIGDDDDDDTGDDDDDDDDDDTGGGAISTIGDSIFTLGNPGSGGLAAFITNRDDFAVLLRALADRSAVKILSAPHIIAADNREAHIQVGQSIPILTGTSTSVLSDNNAVVNQIQYRDTGTILTILPQVNSAGLVNMQITQEVSAVGQEDFGATNSPSFLTREAETTMVVQDGDSILIGGIIDEQQTVSRSGVPYLMDIPVLGRFFRLEQSRHTRTELLILITPHVIRNRDEGLQVTKQFQEGVHGLQGLMEWATGRVRSKGPETDPSGVGEFDPN